MNRNEVVRSMIAFSNALVAARTLDTVRAELRAAASMPASPMRDSIIQILREDAAANIVEIERALRGMGPVETV